MDMFFNSWKLMQKDGTQEEKYMLERELKWVVSVCVFQ